MIEKRLRNRNPKQTGRRPRKIICGANEISWPPAGGVGMIFSAPVSIFNVLPQGGSFDYPPLAAITHFWGILDSVQTYQCASPRGLICLPTWGDCNFPLLGSKSHLPNSLAIDEETIICGALNEKIEPTVYLEHHELLHICKFDHFPLLPGQRPRTNHLRSKWHIQWEDWDRLLRKNTH